MEFSHLSIFMNIAFLPTAKNSQSSNIITKLFQMFSWENFEPVGSGPVENGILRELSTITFHSFTGSSNNVSQSTKYSRIVRNVSQPWQERWNCQLASEREKRARHWGNDEYWGNYWDAWNFSRYQDSLLLATVQTVEKILNTCSVNKTSLNFRRVVIMGENLHFDTTFKNVLDVNDTLVILEKVLSVINDHLFRKPYQCQFTVVLLMSNESLFLDFIRKFEEKKLKQKINGETLVYFVYFEKEVHSNPNKEMSNNKLARSVLITLIEVNQLNKKLALKRITISPCSDFVESFGELLMKISHKLSHNLEGEIIRPILYTDGSPGLNAATERSLALVSAMSVVLNFTINKPVYGDDWISIGPNGSLLGVARLLEASAGDLLSQTHELSIERAQRLDFVFSTVTHREEAFFRQPPRVFDSIMFRPFSSQLLFAMCILLLALFVMMSTILNYKLCTDMNQHAVSSVNSKRGFECINMKAVGDSLMGLVGLFTQQGWHELPGMGSIRILSVSGLCLSLVFYMLYSASILSIIKSRGVPIRSFQELLESGMEVFIDSDAQSAVGIVEEILRTSNQSVVGKRVLRVENGILRILHNTSAFISYRFYMDNAAEFMGKNVFESYCKSVSSVLPNPRGLQIYNGMFVRKHSPLRKSFRYSLIRIKQVGLMKSVLLSEIKPYDSNRCGRKVALVESLPFSVVSPCFSLLFSFSLAGIVLLLLECGVYKVNMKSP